MKLFIIGHGRHGKDTAAEFIEAKCGLTFESSSMFCAEKVVRPWLKKHLSLTYDTLDECYADRHNYRVEWYTAIKEYNTPDRSRLARAIFAEYDMYVGIRDRDEFLAAKQFSDLSIWVDAAERKDYVDPTCKVLRSDCDIIMENNDTEEDLKEKVNRLFHIIQNVQPKNTEETNGQGDRKERGNIN